MFSGRSIKKESSKRHQGGDFVKKESNILKLHAFIKRIVVEKDVDKSRHSTEACVLETEVDR